MNHRLHIHKKASFQSASTPASNLFQSRPCIVPETATPQETPDLQQQQEWKESKGINWLEIPTMICLPTSVPAFLVEKSEAWASSTSDGTTLS